MMILGIDPGSVRIGYGVISDTGKLTLVSYGTIEIKTKNAPERIMEAAKAFEKIIKKYSPDIIAIEKIYFSKNTKTGIEVAQTRGALMLKAKKSKAIIQEYDPTTIKRNVAGYGGADKKAVAKMTAITLGVEKLKGYDDAADALAVALTAAFNTPKNKNI